MFWEFAILVSNYEYVYVVSVKKINIFNLEAVSYSLAILASPMFTNDAEFRSSEAGLTWLYTESVPDMSDRQLGLQEQMKRVDRDWSTTYLHCKDKVILGFL
jgi:hypothetical protein